MTNASDWMIAKYLQLQHSEHNVPKNQANMTYVNEDHILMNAHDWEVIFDVCV